MKESVNFQVGTNNYLRRFLFGIPSSSHSSSRQTSRVHSLLEGFPCKTSLGFLSVENSLIRPRNLFEQLRSRKRRAKRGRRGHSRILFLRSSERVGMEILSSSVVRSFLGALSPSLWANLLSIRKFCDRFAHHSLPRFGKNGAF
jgi:hypothetical protein